MKKRWFYILILVLSINLITSCKETTELGKITIQLNWLHDPTFTGEYMITKDKEIPIVIREGGPNIYPIPEVLSGRATVAVIGSDIFLQAIDREISKGNEANIVCFFVDFQRNPVGWILHPKAAEEAGLKNDILSDKKRLNGWLFSKFKDGTLEPGDKRGTETTSIWIQWKKVHSLPENIKVVPVGFDAGIVLSAPKLAYPVYLNEEPFKLSERIGKEVIVFDPAVDGIELYGNVLITKKENIVSKENLIRDLVEKLRFGWESAKKDQSEAIKEVARYYGGVSESVLNKQVDKTLEFVFYGGNQAGEMDISENGRWHQTLLALQEADLVSPKLSFDILKKYLVISK